MPKTRKPKHPRRPIRHRGATRRTNNKGGSLFQNRKTLKQRFNDTFFPFQSNPTGFIMTEYYIRDDKNDEEFREDEKIKDPSQLSKFQLFDLDRSNFYMCKKSNRFIRSSKKGPCAYLTPGSEYVISKMGKAHLIYFIKMKAADFMIKNQRKIVKEEEHKRKNHKGTMKARILGDLRTRMLKKAINSLYIRTSHKGQTIGDRSNKFNIPISTKDTVVVPAAKYLNSQDLKEIKEFQDFIFQKIIHQSLKQDTHENIDPSVTPVENIQPPESLPLKSNMSPSQAHLEEKLKEPENHFVTQSLSSPSMSNIEMTDAAIKKQSIHFDSHS
jgi:hypothetical protein